MKNRENWVWVSVVIIVMAMIATTGFAQVRTSDDYAITKEVLSCGGQVATSADYSLVGTIGQSSPIGISSDSTETYENQGGFWHAVLHRGTLVGQLDLERSVSPPDDVYITDMKLHLLKGSFEEIYDFTTDDEGNFEVETRSGMFDVFVKGSHSLSVCETNVDITEDASTSLVFADTVPEGDASDDNVVNSTDFFILRSTYNQGEPDYDSRADFNQDSVVNSSDFFLLRGNYNSSGDTCE